MEKLHHIFMQQGISSHAKHFKLSHLYVSRAFKLCQSNSQEIRYEQSMM